MKKLIGLMLFLISVNIFAGWKMVDFTDEFTAYVDKQTISKKGNKVKAWILFDYKSVKTFSGDNSKYLSQISREEYDCAEVTRKGLAFQWYSGNMGGGNVVYVNNIKQDSAVEIPPASVMESSFKEVCGKK